jgi:hypothetical protein
LGGVRFLKKLSAALFPFDRIPKHVRPIFGCRAFLSTGLPSSNQYGNPSGAKHDPIIPEKIKLLNK